ncbi:alpha/beta fold hydrolase [Microbacterium telephonicum]|uniref:Pimeloyl-ACP methyl ester carboxylesterase n=1 Tax=Microbacterium telephonicum TaxID=1714841 RepID=A0A498CBQ1_9MICO|nr:alpha/beta hydrolase [Microbacterium telephonicum]RLK52126.1 pimeloyl-ACP methyl ester carboxylesterase [Microbacterium telephonicum]
MADAIPALTSLPDPQFVMSTEGHRIATYTWGDLDAPTVVCVHGFASNARDNWVSTGWVRDLLRAGFRVLAVDQLGHGASDKPHDPRDYSVRGLAADVEIVLDTHLVDEAFYVGYSLGARVGWEVAQDLSGRIGRVVLGGVPDGIPLGRLDLAQARAYVDDGTPVTDPVTQNYIALTERVGGNDLRALLAIAEGMRRSGTVDPDAAHAPAQPVLFATGSKDAIIEGSKALAAACPQGRFVEIPDRHHFNAPGSRVFREEALAFLTA